MGDHTRAPWLTCQLTYWVLLLDGFHFTTVEIIEMTSMMINNGLVSSQSITHRRVHLRTVRRKSIPSRPNLRRVLDNILNIVPDAHQPQAHYCLSYEDSFSINTLGHSQPPDQPPPSDNLEPPQDPQSPERPQLAQHPQPVEHVQSPLHSQPRVFIPDDNSSPSVALELTSHQVRVASRSSFTKNLQENRPNNRLLSRLRRNDDSSLQRVRNLISSVRDEIILEPIPQYSLHLPNVSNCLDIEPADDSDVVEKQKEKEKPSEKDEEEEEEEQEQSVIENIARSWPHRNRIPPTDFWRNERPIYKTIENGTQELVSVSEGSTDPVTDRYIERRRAQYNQLKKRRGPSHKKWIDPMNLSIHDNVLNPRKVTKKKAKLYASLGVNIVTPESVDFQPIRKAKDGLVEVGYYDTDQTSGAIKMAPFAEKLPSKSKSLSYTFTVCIGAVEFSLGKGKKYATVLKTGSQFRVPVDTIYALRNTRRDPALITFFTENAKRSAS